MTECELEELKPKIVEALKPLNPEKIILFGSYAYGTPTEDSDLDICVVEKDYKNKWKEQEKIRKLLHEIKVPKDILNPRLDEYNFYKNEINSVYYDAETKGILLWPKRV
jgi:predicted nucleotidyltransferase